MYHNPLCRPIERLLQCYSRGQSQMIKDTAGFDQPRRGHVTDLLIILYWLPVADTVVNYYSLKISL